MQFVLFKKKRCSSRKASNELVVKEVYFTAHLANSFYTYVFIGKNMSKQTWKLKVTFKCSFCCSTFELLLCVNTAYVNFAVN